ncbi:hypothetical protein, partial [Acinetobacter baumannii]|uniref:hypothetical protein n=1 Tax=Acinetobacter baumannii TaxID=470 RepID=UPI001A7F0C7F
YIPMKQNIEYLLFLREVESKDVWSVASLGFGKYADNLETRNTNVTSFSKVGELSSYAFISTDQEALST